MKRWYEFYYQRIVNLQQPVEEIEKVNFQQPLGVASYQLQEVVERTIAELENLKKHEIEEI